MEKEKLDKIRQLLEESGVDEEVIAKVESTLTDETPSEEPEVEEETESVEITSEDETPAEAEDESPVEEETPSTEDTEVPSEEPVEPADPIEEVPVEEPVEEPAPVEEEPSDLPPGVEEIQVGQGVPPVEEEAPVADAGSERIAELENKLAESDAAREGLQKRLDALEGALKEAGIMSDSPTSAPVGVDDGTRTPDYHDDEADFDAVLDKFNKRF